MTPRPLPFEVRLPIKVQGYDIDFARIVSNIVYIRWLEDLRMRLLDTYFPLDRQMEQGYVPVLLRTAIDYRRAIALFDPVEGHMWLSGLGKARWILRAEFTVGGVVRAAAEQTGCFMKLESGRPIPIPVELARRYAEITGA